MEDTVSISRVSLGGKVGPADVGVFKVRKMRKEDRRKRCSEERKEGKRDFVAML